MLKVLLIGALVCSCFAAPYDDYKDFFTAMYDSFEGTSGEIEGSCLPSSTQYALQNNLSTMISVLSGDNPQFIKLAVNAFEAA
jgi:hypothetical protein